MKTSKANLQGLVHLRSLVVAYLVCGKEYMGMPLKDKSLRVSQQIARALNYSSDNLSRGDFMALALVLDAFGDELDKKTLKVYADAFLKAYLTDGVVRAGDWLKNKQGAPWYLFDRFEHVAFDQHWMQLNVFYPTVFLPLLCRFHPELEEWVKYSYSLYLYRLPMGSRDDGNWLEDGYMGASEWTLTVPPVLYTRLSDFKTNYFKVKPWFSNVSKYFAHNFKTHAFSDGVGNNVFGGYLNSTVECIWSGDKKDPHNQIVMNRISENKTNFPRYKMSQRLFGYNGITQSLMWFSTLSFRKHFGMWQAEGKTEKAPLAAEFRDTGEAIFNTDLSDINKDLMVRFRSSTYPAANHIHPASNFFNVMYRGQDLFWHTGYYNTGPYPGYDKLDYKNTRGHNAILPDGMVQMHGDYKGFGWLPRFLHGEKISYAVGDAKNAYLGDRELKEGTYWTWHSPIMKELGYGFPQLQKIRRHIALLRPGTIVIYDELSARYPINWTFLMHTRNQENFSRKGDGWLSTYVSLDDDSFGHGNFKLFSGQKFSTKVTDYFFGAHPDNKNGKYGPKYDVSRMKRHHHAYMETLQKSTNARFLAVIEVTNSADSKTVLKEIQGKVDSDGFFTVKSGSYTIKAELNGSKESYLDIRSADNKSVLISGQKTETLVRAC